MPVFRHRLLLIAVIAAPLLSALGGAGGTRAAEHAVPSVQIMQSHPSLFGQLAGGQAVFVRLAYSSEQPVRFRIEGYSAGEQVTESRSNPTPRYPAGEGEALVWMAFDPPETPVTPVTTVTPVTPVTPVTIDELKIIILDDHWQPLAVKIAQAGLRLVEEAPAAEPVQPDWVDRLKDELQILAAMPEPEPEDVPKNFFPHEWVLPMAWAFVLAYVVLQVPMALWLTGKWRLAARVPLLATVPMFLYAIGAYSAGTSLWPLHLLLLSPFVLVYLVGLLAACFFAQRMAAG